MAGTLNKMGVEIDKDKKVERHFMIPIQDLLLSVKLVEKDKDRKNVKTPYIKVEILIPKELGTSVAQFVSSDWGLLLMGVKYKKKKSDTNG